jgi:hypothetical protein
MVILGGFSTHFIAQNPANGLNFAFFCTQPKTGIEAPANRGRSEKNL